MVRRQLLRLYKDSDSENWKNTKNLSKLTDLDRDLGFISRYSPHIWMKEELYLFLSAILIP